MLVTKCDLCKKGMAREKIVTAGLGYEHFDLCEKCGAPILNFLKKHKFIEEKKERTSRLRKPH